MSRNNNNNNNQRDRKPGMAEGVRSSDDRSYPSARPGREKNMQSVSSNNRSELRRSDRENDLYERQSI
jgi:hypothetical protein